MPQERFSPNPRESEPPETPLLRTIIRAEGSYGLATSPLDILNASITGSLWGRKSCQIIVLMGSPGSGKTTLASEMVALTEYLFRLNRANRQRVRYVPYEGALEIAKQQGFRRNENEDSEGTKRYYGIVNKIFEEKIESLIKPSAIIFVETPGMVMRGDTVIQNLGKKLDSFTHHTYTPSFVMLTRDSDFTLRIIQIRREMERTGLKRETLEGFGTRVHINHEDDEAAIPSVSFETLRRYFESEGKFLTQLARDLGIRNFRYSPNTTGNEFLEKVFSNWFFGRENLGVDPQRVFVGRNRLLPRGSDLYTSALKRHDVFKPF